GDKSFAHTGTVEGWLRCHHIRPGSWRVDPSTGRATTPEQPALIKDFLSYNVTHGYNSDDPTQAHYWVPDLIVECAAEFGSASDSLTLELNKGNVRYQAMFDNGYCRLYRVQAAAATKQGLMAEATTKIEGGKHD